MADIIHFPSKRGITEIPRGLIALVLEELIAVETSYPQLVSALKRYPPLLEDFLRLGEKAKDVLQSFYRCEYNHYFTGRTTGDCIRKIDHFYSGREFKTAANIARKYRLAEQLLKMYECYAVEHPQRPFTRAYMQRQDDGLIFLAMIRNNDFSLGEIVSLAAEVKPEIKLQYQAPEHRKRKTYGNVADLRR